MNWGKQNERGQELVSRAVGMAGKMGKAGKTQPADSPPGSGLKTNDGPQLAGLAVKTAAAADDVGLSPCR